MTFDLANFDPDLIQGELSRRSLKHFVKTFWPCVEPSYKFLDNWHLDAICDHLVNIKDIKNLLVNIPPRTAKTLIVSVFFPAWLWLHEPGKRFMFSSYSMDLSEDAAAKCRDLIAADLYQKCYGHLYKLDNVLQKRHFENDKKGFRLATSVMGVTTGFGADILVIDDPHNVKKAESEVERLNVIKWYNNSFYNRLNDPATGCRIVIGQRVHRNDLSGYITNNLPDWTRLIIPYEYKSAVVSLGFPKLGVVDPRTEEGQPLWASRFPEREIKAYKRNRAVFETQYNQNPISVESALFREEDLRYYTETEDAYLIDGRQVLKEQCIRFAAVDLAISTKTDADYTAIVTCDVSPYGDIILLNCTRERMPGTRIIPTLKKIKQAYNPSLFLIEDVAFQRLILQEAKAAGLTVRGMRPTADKVARSIPLQIKVEGSQVWLPQDKAWLGTLEDELLAFPDSDHDDMVDALAYIAIEVCRRRFRKLDEGEPYVPTPEERQLQQQNELWRKMWEGTDR